MHLVAGIVLAGIILYVLHSIASVWTAEGKWKGVTVLMIVSAAICIVILTQYP